MDNIKMMLTIFKNQTGFGVYSNTYAGYRNTGVE